MSRLEIDKLSLRTEPFLAS